MLEDLSLAALVLVALVLARAMATSVTGVFKEGVADASSTGVIGAMSEVDKIVRPSIEHVIKARDERTVEDDGIGGE